MNEIEKMYKLANLKAINIAEYGSTYIPQVVEIDGKLYPPFTAEKQIEITKFLISKYARFKKFRSYEQKDLYMVYYECRYYPKQYLPFGEALAESINYLWQDLTEEEKRQITDIFK